MRTLSLFLLCGFLVLFAGPAQGSGTVAYKVVVHPSNPVTEVERARLAQLFFKKTTQWDSGVTAMPVDLNDSSPVRTAFCDEVLKRSLPAVRAYWQQRIFSGRDVPPPELATDDDVLAFVRANPGAVGYVAAGTPTPGLKVITIRN
ncbi:hypothetical protein JYK02_08510 [Corallococcus macrosporus]|uniref:Phosphate ABC transporter substrate-binding protein n=1 Tax=Corallococcus macrosporus TaxID=35 RepID=A0ABS3D9C3_9BACT|nr:hypothetical protein [Corallococcus macrosporus]MBN8227547.1 hypothetical protein [Corallococcus macrosporus]